MGSLDLIGGGGFSGVAAGPVRAAAAAQAGAGTTSELRADWREWVAENVLRGNTADSILQAMTKAGIDRGTAAAEINTAMNHPYLAAARKVGGGAGGPTLDNKLKKRDWVLDLYRRSARLSPATSDVPRVRRPSRQQFLDEYYAVNRPVVIQGAMDNWPAMKRWTADQLKARFGDRVVQVQANRDKDAAYEINQEKLKKEMTFGEFVDITESAGQTNNWYMTANNSGKNKATLRELWDDIILFPEYLSDSDPTNRGFFWFGPAGTVTPLHHDLTNNFMAQVRGRKLVRLIAPYELANLYNTRHCYSAVDLDHVDEERFPQFKDVRVIDVVIAPGDLLFLPVGWWHYVRGLDISITMTFTNFVFDNTFTSTYTTYSDI